MSNYCCSTKPVLHRPVESSQFTSWAFSQRALTSGLLPSMGAVGSCYENAVIESFWGRMKVELLNRRWWNTRLELANAIFEYLEIFHNRRRRYSALGMLTPNEYEEMNRTIQWHEIPATRVHGTRGTSEPGADPFSRVTAARWRPHSTQITADQESPDASVGQEILDQATTDLLTAEPGLGKPAPQRALVDSEITSDPRDRFPGLPDDPHNPLTKLLVELPSFR